VHRGRITERDTHGVVIGEAHADHHAARVAAHRDDGAPRFHHLPGFGGTCEHDAVARCADHGVVGVELGDAHGIRRHVERGAGVLHLLERRHTIEIQPRHAVEVAFRLGA
jgi:hypothetical protein